LVILLFGLFINVMTLPGLWLMAATFGIYGWLTWSRHYVGWRSIALMGALATIAEVVEIVAGGAGAKKAGASRRAMIGAVVGGILGAMFLTFLIPIPIVGTIIGVCLGAALGAGIVELIIRRDLGQAIRVGGGAFKGRLMGIVSKLAIGAVMLLIAMICGFPR
jgi:uncharacterized protein YqgC (DUF456 family)